MNKIYIIHCWDGTKEDGWYPWLDKELSNENNKVYRFFRFSRSSPNVFIDLICPILRILK